MTRWLALLTICLAAEATWGHILRPGRSMANYEWAEPDGAVYLDDGKGRTASALSAAERIAALRAVMVEHNVDAYVVPTADAHNSQYIAPSDARREWLSGLTGSSGTAVVTADHALVWTDGRYFTQFYQQVDTEQWGLMRQGEDLSVQAWLASNLTSGAVVGVDPTTYTRTSWVALQTALTPSGIQLEATEDNLVDKTRVNVDEPAPARPSEPVFGLPVEFSGKPSNEKIAELLRQISARGATALVLTALDDIAYTLNLRGSDIPYNPVFFAYLVLRVDVSTDDIILFWGDGQLPTEVESFLTGEGTTVSVRPYSEIFTFLSSMATTLPEGSTIWLSQDGSHAIHLAAEAEGRVTTLSTVSPVALMKTVKNEVELEGFRSAHIKDGIAVVRFLRWVHEQVDAGVNVTEVDVGNKLLELRGEEQDFMGASFATIAGAGENGAIIHYKADPEGPQRVITKEDMLLVDSGGQYKDGTTDITRTRHMSTPTDMQKLTFTRVLKGQILMGTAVFPRGITGNILETLARKALWDVGLNYAHGTGHGVGHFLNVHEGPGGIGSTLIATDPGIFPGMIFSDGKMTTGHMEHSLNVHEGPGGIGSALIATDPGIFPGMIFSDGKMTTGHMEHSLNVHEGPGGIGSALIATDPGIFPGMIFSDGKMTTGHMEHSLNVHEGPGGIGSALIATDPGIFPGMIFSDGKMTTGHMEHSLNVHEGPGGIGSALIATDPGIFPGMIFSDGKMTTGHMEHSLNVHEGPGGIGSTLIATDPGIFPGMIFSDGKMTTGHMEHSLNVHEGPGGIGSALIATDPGIFPGMIFSDGKMTTGHMEHSLNVHEGPGGIGSALIATDPGIFPGMIFSDGKMTTGHMEHSLNVHEGPGGIGSALIATDPGIFPGMIFSDGKMTTGHMEHSLNVHEGPGGIGSALIATDPGIFPGMIFSDGAAMPYLKLALP